MQHFQRMNTIVGWLVFLIATTVYWLTLEPTASFWDCGEFIACSYKLEVPHPPGAPFFLLFNRLFSFLAAGDVYKVAYYINLSSALASGFTILFLFWSISMLALKLLPAERRQAPSAADTLLVIGASSIGALAYAFSDSFWFSAVEAEVYAMSSFFTAFVIWAMLKWERESDVQKAQRWLLLIAYMVGLSIGVHILNLVCLPALALIYYYKKQQEKQAAPTLWGALWAMAIGGAIILAIIVFIIPGLPELAGKFEIFFVNSLGLPFNSGLIFFSLLLLGGLVWALVFSLRKQKHALHLALLMLTLVLIGYGSYGIVLIRAQFNPPINENAPSDAIRIVSYLKREQYGDRPLLYGPVFTARPIRSEKVAPLYRKDEAQGKYVIYDYKEKYIYNKNMLFPRIYSREGNHGRVYRQILGLREGEEPTFADNIAFLLKHQIGHMYFRYFMWNFAGRESDIQNAGFLAPWDSNQDLPELLAKNKGRNQYYSLPLLLGILGLFFAYGRNRQVFYFTLLLFFFMGIALVLYLNSPPVEPRERDYIYVGSFYAFAMWIGFGVMALADLVGSFLKNKQLQAALATVLCLPVPGIMAAEGWDDHDRSDRYFQIDIAKNILNSCAPNAILFTAGDNDTFPLWYVQEVEGFRTDVRVCNLSLFATDWYISQMKRQVYESAPLPISMEEKDFAAGVNEQVIVTPAPQLGETQAKALYEKGVDLNTFFKLLQENHPVVRVPNPEYGQAIAILPSNKVYLKLNLNPEKVKNWLPAGKAEDLPAQMEWTLPTGQFFKNSLAVLNVIATNNANGWERPIYFAPTLGSSDYMGLEPYLQVEGFAYRLTPIKLGAAGDLFVNTDIMYETMMQKTFWRNLDRPDIHYNEDYRRFVLIARNAFARLAEQLIMEGKKDKAQKVLLESLRLMPDASVPYDVYSVQYIQLLLLVDETTKAKEIAEVMARRAKEEIEYALRQQDLYSNNLMANLYTLNHIVQVFEQYKLPEATQYKQWLQKYEGLLQ
ncbi:hypothetical protein FHS56_002064 [Thermonema lapsum]|uniref:DUF2723 domain-containing protein n=1 Tax=Thermonema lapsum TaxID=28195 RepID=A0A846MSX6_9BACT|nr:DUF2723 domain-containing protein [Thermonema lapsum]NIK74539.1 hypothetical protein [Thermonema lapsum]